MADLRDIAKNHPGASISIVGGIVENESDYNSNVTVEGVTKLTWSELQAEMAKVAYVGKRAAEYPSVIDQLDKIYHSGIDEWKKVIKVTKDKYPKPE